MPDQSNLKVLIIDDEADIRELIEITLARMGIKSDAVASITQAKQCLEQNNYFLCLADMRLPDGQGIDIVKQYHHKVPIAVITAYGNVEGAVNTLKAGAFDYVSKPIDLQILRRLVNTAKSIVDLSDDVNSPQTLLGNSQVMNYLRERIKKLARSQAPVYINGASGSGKELVAKLIHQLGPRATSPFVPVNCGAIPAELMESEFFGHTKGSFTGAVSDKVGLFQAADGGTLFLDEVADLPLTMQVKLLRAIQERSVRPIGAAKEMVVDVRILSASHKNLNQLVAEGKFRRDLFYRINVIELEVPSLKEHLDDISIIAEAILAKIAHHQESEKMQISAEALALLKNYDFPGNVRELENILERAVVMCEHNVIHANDLQLSPCAKNDNDAADDLCLDDYLATKERALIMQTLENVNWNRTKAARNLGISLRALRYRLKKLAIE